MDIAVKGIRVEEQGTAVVTGYHVRKRYPDIVAFDIDVSVKNCIFSQTSSGDFEGIMIIDQESNDYTIAFFTEFPRKELWSLYAVSPDKRDCSFCMIREDA